MHSAAEQPPFVSNDSSIVQSSNNLLRHEFADYGSKGRKIFVVLYQVAEKVSQCRTQMQKFVFVHWFSILLA